MGKVTRTLETPRPRGAYSQVIVAGGFVFVSGQIPVNPKTNELEPGEIRSQTRRVLENIRLVLETAGCQLRDVVRVSVFLADMSDFPAMNKEYGRFFPNNPPARTTVGVQLGKFKVEIDCIARLPRSRRRQ